jgi:hypothetical protein
LEKALTNNFQECFLHLYSRWQNCVFAQGDYFEVNIDSMILWLVFLTNKVIPGIFWIFYVYVVYGWGCMRTWHRA